MAVIIRPARIEDAPGMARVIVDTFLWANRAIMPEAALQKRAQTWTYEVSARNWAAAIVEAATTAHTCIYVAVAPIGSHSDGDEAGAALDKGQEQIIGLALGCPATAAMQADDEAAPPDGTQVGELDVLYVQVNAQGQGVGRRLLQTVATHLARQGCVSLRLATPAASHQARRFYASLGARQIGTREDDEDGVKIPLVIYE